MPYSDVPSWDTQAAKVDFIKPYLPMVASASAIRERHFWILLEWLKITFPTYKKTDGSIMQITRHRIKHINILRKPIWKPYHSHEFQFPRNFSKFVDPLTQLTIPIPLQAPMLEQALFDPVSEVKREAAKTFGVMEQVQSSDRESLWKQLVFICHYGIMVSN